MNKELFLPFSLPVLISCRLLLNFTCAYICARNKRCQCFDATGVVEFRFFAVC